MNKNSAVVGGLLVGLAVMGEVGADEHTEQALQHADQAAHSVGDSASIQEHAIQALKHIDAAKASTRDPETLTHLEHGESDLRHALSHARRFNSSSASEDAGDARGHLEKALNASGEGHSDDP